MNYLSLLKRYPNYIAFGVIYNFFSGPGQTFIFALFIPDLERVFDLTPAESGSYYGVITLLSAFLLLYTGSLIDRIHLRTYSVTVTAILGGAALLMASAQNLMVMLLAMFLLRHLGQGLMTHTAHIATARYFTKNRGKATSLKSIGMSISEVFLPIIIALIIAGYGWRMGYVSLGVSCLLLCIPLNILLLKRDDPFQIPHPHEDTTSPLLDEKELNWSKKQLLGHSYFWIIAPLIISPGFILTALFFQQGVIADSKGWSMTLMASGFISYGIFHIVGNLFIGPIIDRFSASRILPLSIIPIAMGMSMLLISDSPWIVYLYMGLMGLGIGFGSGVYMTIWAEIYGRKHLGAIQSFISTLAIIGTAAAPPIVGLLLTKGVTVDSLITNGIAFILLASLLAFFAKPPRVEQ